MITPHPRRRFFRYSLRTLLVVVTVFCVFLGTIGLQIKRAREQRLSVEAILELGGFVSYAHERNQSDPPGPEWLRWLIGDEYFVSVVAVGFRGGRSPLPGIIDYAPGREPFFEPNVTDEDLSHLRDLTNLENLYISSNKVTDAGLKLLKDLPQLRQLYLRSPRITGEGLKKLRQDLPNCEISYRPQ